jgi:ATP-dependent protease ClpP protease subunit
MIFKDFTENNANNRQANDQANNQNTEPNDCGGVTVDVGGMSIRCIAIIGQVEGHSILPDAQKSTKYEHLLPLLVDVEEDDRVGGLLFLLNTVGGDVEAGLAIAELIASMKKPTVSLVLGGGHSIGVPLAVSAKRSFIVPSATMTVHPVRISGTLIGAPQTYRYFSRMQNRITDFVVTHSNITKEQFNGLLARTEEMATDVGSILEGKEAVEAGLIDAVGGLADAIAALKSMQN